MYLVSNSSDISVVKRVREYLVARGALIGYSNMKCFCMPL